jgi:integrative and conjugative element protein (TIGR02256 family)
MTVYINKEALEFICNEVKHSRNIETGGILLGVVLKTGDILITHAIGPGPCAIKKYGEFRKDYDYSVKMLYSFYGKYSVDFLGDWHKHPNDSTGYSFKDYISMIKICKSNTQPCFFIIVGSNFIEYNCKEVCLYYVSKKDFGVKKIDFEIIENPEELALDKGLSL